MILYDMKNYTNKYEYNYNYNYNYIIIYFVFKTIFSLDFI
jgi:hypothetical protein